MNRAMYFKIGSWLFDSIADLASSNRFFMVRNCLLLLTLGEGDPTPLPPTPPPPPPPRICA
ncbi:MAG: hypothetical protein ONB31_05435 [candidate division KSB1 bacterium]|nr:hypothetical protein [candidate division KSB1 bacterium]MDZ7333639.1 hypothetical protein [candidate division KSB1 bacterium]MDZ7398753.1 hypothetical protein [candidate division KSB1 bacterium]